MVGVQLQAWSSAEEPPDSYGYLEGQECQPTPEEDRFAHALSLADGRALIAMPIEGTTSSKFRVRLDPDLAEDDQAAASVTWSIIEPAPSPELAGTTWDVIDRGSSSAPAWLLEFDAAHELRSVVLPPGGSEDGERYVEEEGDWDLSGDELTVVGPDGYRWGGTLYAVEIGDEVLVMVVPEGEEGLDRATYFQNTDRYGLLRRV